MGNIANRTAQVRKSDSSSKNVGKALMNIKRKTAERKQRREEVRSQEYIVIMKRITEVSRIIMEQELRLEELETATEMVVEEVKEVQNKLIDLKAELENLQDTMCQLIPRGDGLISILFFDDKGEELLHRGLISHKGRTYNSLEELYEHANAVTTEEQLALEAGNRLLFTPPEPLVIEVFPHVINKVNANGEVCSYRVEDYGTN